MAPQTAFHVTMPHRRNPFDAYRPAIAPPLNLENSPRLQSLMRDGKLYISLQDAIDLAIENNLDLAYARYEVPTAQTDLARTLAGGHANGVNTAVVSSATQGGVSAGSTPGGPGGGTTSGAGAAGAGGLVQSTLGEGTYVQPFDPVFSVQAFDDHTKTQEVNTIQYGVPLYEQNTVAFGTAYQQYFSTGTGINFTLQGERLANNSPEDIVNPDISMNYKLTLTQPLLAGFGPGTNKRWIRIARKNLELTDYAFKAQAIATITGVQDIYWDLVDAYEDEQIKAQTVDFANETLTQRSEAAGAESHSGDAGDDRPVRGRNGRGQFDGSARDLEGRGTEPEECTDQDRRPDHRRNAGDPTRQDRPVRPERRQDHR